MIYDVIVIGGGPAGMGAARSAYEHGAKSVLLIDRGLAPGGVLLQCHHDGFGEQQYGESLTGPAYAQRAYEKIKDVPEITIWLDTVVLAVTKEKQITAVSPDKGVQTVEGKSIIFATGCQERSRGAIRLPGDRLAGIITAGVAQRLVNCFGFLPGKQIVILGSGDIGLVTAKALSKEGCTVKAVLEAFPYCSGSEKNINKCLKENNIPLYISHTITDIQGDGRVEKITVSKLDDRMQPIKGTEFEIECDTVVLSVGMIPENSLLATLPLALQPVAGGPVVDQNRETQLAGFFAAGDVVHVHETVDFMAQEAEIAGRAAAEFAIKGKDKKEYKEIKVKTLAGIRDAVPEVLRLPAEGSDVKFFLWFTQPAENTCLEIKNGSELLYSEKLAKVNPGEMLMLNVAAKYLHNLNAEITVGLQADKQS